MDNTVLNSKIGGGTEQKQRNSNIELLRICMMLMIVAHHYVVNSNLPTIIESSPLTTNTLFLFVFGMWGKIGINSFVLITAYYMAASKISINKFLKLLGEIMFYKVGISIIFWVIDPSKISVKTIAEAFVPIVYVEKNYTGCFLIFYLCIPLLNALIHGINEKQHLAAIGLGLFTYTFFETVPISFVEMNYVSWFIVIYFIGSYVHMYPKTIFSKCKFWGFLSIALIIVDICSVLLMAILTSKKLGHVSNEYYFVFDANALWLSGKYR